jgi:hypothetical protein
MKLVYILLIIFLLSFVLVNAALTCTTKSSCTGNEIALFRMSSLTNAHAQNLSYSTYPYVVCCKDTINPSALGNSCSGTYSEVIALSSDTNAQGEMGLLGIYPVKICLSSNNYVDCQASSDCSTIPPNDYVCVATLSSTVSPYSNSHVAACPGDTTDPYPTQICCKADTCSDTGGTCAQDSDCCITGVQNYGCQPDGTCGCDPGYYWTGLRCEEIEAECIVPSSCFIETSDPYTCWGDSYGFPTKACCSGCLLGWDYDCWKDIIID